MNERRNNDSDGEGNTIPDAFDRRSSNRDAANWIGRRLDETREQIKGVTTELGKTRLEVVVEVQRVEDKLDHVDAKVEELKTTLIKSVPNGDPDAHLRDHLQIAVERKEREEVEAEAKAFRKDLIKKLKTAVVMAVVGLFTLGVFEQARVFVLNVVAGKSAHELRDGK